MKKIHFIGILIIISITFISVLYRSNDSKQVLTDQKNHQKVMNSALSLMLETQVNSGIYEEARESGWPSEGYKFNAERSKCENGSELRWENNKVIMTGHVSDKCYVYFDVYVPPKYWNNDFDYEEFPLVDGKPTTPGSDLTYPSLEALKAGYGEENFESRPFYIKTTEKENQACLYWKDTGKEFCMSAHYWVKDDTTGEATKTKLQEDMKNALGVVPSSCDSDLSHAYCYVSSFRCLAVPNGTVYCGIEDSSVCDVRFYGDAYCMW